MSDIASTPPRSRLWNLFLGCALVVGVAYQVFFLWREVASPTLSRAWMIRDRSSLARSAQLSMRSAAAEYLDLIRRHVPPSGTVLLVPPLRDEVGRFHLEKAMLYYLMPRTLEECPSPEESPCRELLSDPSVAVLSLLDFPRLETVAGKTFVPFDDPEGVIHGLYVPPSTAMATGTSPETPPIIVLLAADLSILAALWCLGAVVVGAILGRGNRDALAVLGFPVGLGALTWTLFVLSLLAIRLTAATVGITYLGILGAAIAGSRIAHPHVPGQHAPWDRSRRPRSWWLVVIPAAVAVVLILGAMLLSVLTAYVLQDPAQIWGVKGYGIALEGDVRAAAEYGVHGLAYPLNIPLGVSVFRLIDGDALPGSKLIFPLLGVALIAGCVRFLIRHGVRPPLAWVGGVLILSTPVLYHHFSLGMANLPFTTYLVLGTMWSIEGLVERRPGAHLIGGTLLGMAAWTRAEGILFVGAIGAVLLLASPKARADWRRFAAWAVPMAVIPGTWFAFAYAAVRSSQLGEAVDVFSAEFLHNPLQVLALQDIARTIWWDSTFNSNPVTLWGVGVVLGVGLGLAEVVRFLRKERREDWAVLGSGLMAAAMAIGEFYVRSYSRENYAAVVDRSLPRALFPGAVLLLMFALLSLRGDEMARDGTPPAIPNGP